MFVVSTSAQQKQSGTSDPPDTETGDLVKAVQNPVASLISVPFQNNINPDIGPNGRVQNVLNIQPVIPISITENWNLYPSEAASEEFSAWDPNQ